MRHEQFVRREIQDLLAKGYIQELSEKPYCTNPLTVAVGKKLRMVLDARHVNSYLKYCPIKYEDWSLLEQVIEQEDYFITFDYVSGYLHIPIFPEHRKYLGFAYHWGDEIKYFSFNQLCFGVSSASYIFTKVNRPLVKYWRETLGIKVFLYVDDGVACFGSLHEANKMTPMIRRDLYRAEILVNEEKSSWIPSRTMAWLGYRFDSVSMIISVSESKIAKLVDLANGLVAQRMASPRQVAQITGLLISMRRAIGSESRLMSRNMLAWIDDTLQVHGASSHGNRSNLGVVDIYTTQTVNLDTPTCFHHNTRSRELGWDRRSILPRSVKEEGIGILGQKRTSNEW